MRILSARERQVAELTACGWARKRIARHLGIAVGTVDTYLTRVAAKLPDDRWPPGRRSIRIAHFVLVAASTGAHSLPYIDP